MAGVKVVCGQRCAAVEVADVVRDAVLVTVYESSLMVASRLGASRGSVSSSEVRDTAATLHVQQPITPELQTSPLY